ncbi:MAG: HAMP domain-containing sensor histidine kinase [Lachnospiraceae bacterium]|nr:HAMP domain-containing sensor histidine kinase [Lachnospiraceae bacterium]
MIKKLQRKFIGITMLSLFVVLLLVEGTINGINIYQISQKSETLLTMLSENDGAFPKGNPNQNTEQNPEQNHASDGDQPQSVRPLDKHDLFGFRLSAETPFETRYFSVRVASDGSQSIDVSHVASISEEEAGNYATEILKSQKNSGYIEQYRYHSTVSEDSTLLVFVDCRNDLQSIRSFAIISMLVGAVCMALVLLPVIVLSGRAVRPVMESMQKQKQFITDAGHEIKTPIAIISANTEVLEMCSGENEWTISIHHQVDRLHELVKNLLTLSKVDETREKLPMAEFSLGKVVREVSESFDAMEQAKHLTVTRQIDEKQRMVGDENSIRHLISILMDNAVKYSDEGGTLRIEGKGKERTVTLCFYNSCEEVPQGDLSRLFDRFYRADPSRARESGGYGIGLSVAAAIVHAHKGKIQALRQEEGICFSITLPGGIPQ